MIALQKFFCITLCLLLPETFCFAAASWRFEFAEVHMGTQFKIILYATNEEMAKRAAKKAFNRIAQLDATMSDYKETSELNRFCHKGVKKPVKLSSELFRVFSVSQKLAARTDGAFDITVGAVVRLWRRARRTNEMPAKERIVQALQLTGYKKLHLNAKTQTAWLEKEGMLLDLGGIAKGFAADEAMRVLKGEGIGSALIAAGGDIVVSAAPPQKRGWVVAIVSAQAQQNREAQKIDLQNPSNDSSVKNLLLVNAAVSTSGDAEQFVEIDGIRYSHIVDPRTGLGVKGQSSVTVVARRGADADALATAVSVLGAERGLLLIDETPNAAALMVKKNTGGFEFLESRRWKAVPKSSKVTAQ
jgi:thiamine biosynthesis lipoprotein